MKTLKKSRPGKKNDKRKLERQSYPVTDYSYSFPQIGIRPPPERDIVNKLVFWNTLGIQILDAIA